MKSFKFLVIAIVATFAISVFTSCEKVQPNYQGVLMENYGKNGKSDFSYQKGRVWVAAPGVELYQVPLWEQRGDFEDRVLQLKSSDNTEFTTKPMYTFKAIENRCIDLVFDNKQVNSDGEEFMVAIMNNVLEPKIYDLIKEQSRKYNTDILMSDGGALFEAEATEVIAQAFQEKGLELITFSCPIDFTDKIKNKIDMRNEANTNISVLDQQIEEQKKRNELAKLQTEYNLIITRGLTQEILTDRFIEKLNGNSIVVTQTPNGIILNK